MHERPFLTACWSELVLLNFAVPTDVIARLVPPGTEPDLHEGQSYVSIVGFRFHTTRVLGLAFPGHTSFPEINLRYYVRRNTGNEVRRGVVFVREIVPRRAVALTANWLYNENYIARTMRSTLQMTGPTLTLGDTLEYAWRSKSPLPDRKGQGESSNALKSTHSRFLRLRPRNARWNRLAARVAAPLTIPSPNSLEEFFVEHYWGYVRARDGTTREYRVAHAPWQVALADTITWDCDLAATYTTPLVEYLAVPPTNAFIADGAPVQIYRRGRI
jgi:uncharacterized protein